MVLDNGSIKVFTCKVAPGAAGGAHGRSGIMLAAGLPALHGSEPGQVRKEAATAIFCKCRGQGSPPVDRSPYGDACCPPQYSFPPVPGAGEGVGGRCSWKLSAWRIVKSRREEECKRMDGRGGAGARRRQGAGSGRCCSRAGQR